VASKSFFSRGIQLDPRPDLMVDENPDGKGVGPWVPKDKHRLLTDYLHGTRNAWKTFPKRALIDPFCGPGRIRVSGEMGTRDGGAIAAWREMHNDATPFTDVFVGDLDPAKSEACAARLQALGASVRPFAGPAVETVPHMVAAVPRGALCMAYIDPYCLTLLDFEMLRTLSALKVDLAIHFSTMDLQRNVIIDLAGKRDNFERVAPGWKSSLDMKTTGVSNIRHAFFDYWRGLLVKLGYEHSREMPWIYNTQGAAMYRLVFFARHDMPLRVWRDVARQKTRDMFED
jgi:three-Cys-motif partner protein